jgi:hypothetical protein
MSKKEKNAKETKKDKQKVEPDYKTSVMFAAADPKCVINKKRKK